MTNLTLNEQFGAIVSSFEDDDPTPVCKGYNLLHEDDTREKKTCDKAVKIQAVRSCCGRVDQFCMDCYNAVCAFHASKQEQDDNSTSSHNKHNFTGRPFSQVNFI